MSSDIPSNGLRAIGEPDRSEEFKANRQLLVSRVNKWLDDLVTIRNTSTQLADGTFLENTPRIIITELGTISENVHRVGMETKKGIVILGDKNGQLQLQAVIEGDSPDDISIIVATGSDPIATMVYGDEYSAQRQSEVVASLSWMLNSHGSTPSEINYMVMGSGEVIESYQQADGYGKSHSLQTPAELHVAQLMLDELTEIIR